MKLTWLGHSCFKLESGNYSVVLDPYKAGSVPGLGPVDESADLVLCSHEHFDHNAREEVKTPDEVDLNHPFNIMGIASCHDDKNGELRGDNTIFYIECEGMKIVHLGDQGCDLTNEQVFFLHHCDVLMIPVGGNYTIDAKLAKQIVGELNPVVTIPMHYSSADFGFDAIARLDKFTDLCEDVKCYDSATIEVSKGMESQTAVLKAARAQ